MKPAPRPLPARELAATVDSGSRWAWQLEAKLAGLYEERIRAAYDGAATALEARALTAAAPPGWSKPNEDELGDALRKKYEAREDAPATAIRVEAMRRVTKAGLEAMHINLDAVNPLLKGVISGLGGNIQIADTTRRDVLRSIDKSWQDGDSIPRTAAKIRQAGAEISKSRSVLIARTELIGAINAAAHALGTISNDYTPAGGAPLLKIWLTAEDEKVRETHMDAGDAYGAGSGIPMSDAFQVGDSSMQFPGDQNGSAEEVCNCRCALSYEEATTSARGPAPSAAPAGDVAVAQASPPAAPSTLSWGNSNIDDPLHAAQRNAVDAEWRDAYESTSTLSPRTVEAVAGYSGTGYGDANAVLRGGEAFRPEEAKKTIDDLHAAFREKAEHATFSQPALLYRASSAPAGADLAPGAVIRDPGFMSTSLDPAFARTFAVPQLDEDGFEMNPGREGREKILLRLHTPAGTPFLPGFGEGEYEALLNSGQEYRIIGLSAHPVPGVKTYDAVLEPAARTASIGGTMDGDVEFKGRTYRPTGHTASGVPVYALASDLPDEAAGATPLADLADAVPSESAIENARAWTSVLCLEGVSTSDGRMFGADAWRWRTLPLTIAMQFELEPEHMGAIPVGRIDEIEKMPVAAAIKAGLMDDRDGGYEADAVAVVGHGVFDASMVGDEAMRLIGDKIQRGVSADYAPGISEVVEMPPLAGQEFGNLMEICLDAELLAATIVSQPAFEGTTIMLDALSAGVWPSSGARSPGVAVTRASIRLARVAPTMTAAAVDFSSHCMVAAHPTAGECSAIAQPGGQPAGDLHVTLAFLPNPDSIDFDKLNAVVSKVAADHKTISGKVGGAGYFAPSDAPPAKSPDAAPAEKDAPVTAAAAPAEPVADPETPPDSEDTSGDGAPAPASEAKPGPLHPHVALVDAPGLSAMRGALCNALDDAGIEYAQNHDFTPHVTLGYEATPGAPAMTTAGAPLTFSQISVHQGAARRDHPMSDAEPAGLTASAAGLAPLEPPTDWFENPELVEPTPLTITDDGRIFGHLATWGTCHVGIRDACVQPPASELDYALFHLGHIKTSDGDLVPVGTFTMDTGHADLRLDMRAALAHYDNTGTAVADVRCGEDDHGIWFAGAIRPDLEATKVRALRAAQISGDWRKHNGVLEFCAGLAVNVPGYPVVRPRTALAASGDATGLVAAGVDLRPAPMSPLDAAAKRLALLDRLEPGTLAAERERTLARIH